jgi:predicted RNA-binding Zn-ribbon protein involved in translation (DUF1610 family)
MKCHFCKIDMIESDELCWKAGEPIIQETGELYSKRYTCPKCGHWERNNFQLKDFEGAV